MGKLKLLKSQLGKVQEMPKIKPQNEDNRDNPEDQNTNPRETTIKEIRSESVKLEEIIFGKEEQNRRQMVTNEEVLRKIFRKEGFAIETLLKYSRSVLVWEMLNNLSKHSGDELLLSSSEFFR